jgi:hypothetical protein
MTLSGYVKRSKAVGTLDPNPFQAHTDGPWHERNFQPVVNNVVSLLTRFRATEIDKHHLLHGKDNGPNKRDTLSYWLYYQHHPGSEKWKLMGQRYWSVEAWRSWREAGGGSFPKRGDRGLVSEHVVPKKVLKTLLIECDPSNCDYIRRLLELNLCCVVTRAEDKQLKRDKHPNVDDPWIRYAEANNRITLIHNPYWIPAEVEPLLRHGLIG